MLLPLMGWSRSGAGTAGTNGSIAGLAENRSQAAVLIRPGACSAENVTGRTKLILVLRLRLRQPPQPARGCCFDGYRL